MAAAAGFSSLLLASILLLIETQKGQLVIETDAENVTIKLLSDGKEYDTVKVQPGATATKLFAGKYEIEIDGASDDLLIDNESVLIRRGETVLARIKRAGSVSPTTTSSELSTEPVYEGKPLSVWLNHVATERNAEQLNNAVEAVKKLASPDDGEQVRRVLIDTLAKNDDQNYGSKSGEGYGGVEILHRALMDAISSSLEDQEKFFEYVVAQLKSADSNLADRIYKQLPYDDANSAPLLHYLLSVLSNGSTQNGALPAAHYARNHLLPNRDKIDDLNLKLSVVLYANEDLDANFWLDSIPDENFYGYLEAISDKAIQALESQDTSGALH